MKIQLLAVTALLAGTALTAAGCAAPRYEDCEVDDQRAYESDCGYWTLVDGTRLLHDGDLPGATWTWWSWVIVGQASFPPEGWKPPYGLKPPHEDAEARKRREAHEKKLKQQNTHGGGGSTRPATRGSGNPPPRTGSGNQGVPKGNTAPKPAAPPPARRR